jgi:hypothetical protein
MQMTNGRNVPKLVAWEAIPYHFQPLGDLALTVLQGAWSGEYAGAWIVGSREDIKLLTEFGIEDGFSAARPIRIWAHNLRKYLNAAYKVYPRGYLCAPCNEAAAGVRLLRFTQVSVLGESRSKCDYMVSAPSGKWMPFDPDAWLKQLEMVKTVFGE